MDEILLLFFFEESRRTLFVFSFPLFRSFCFCCGLHAFFPFHLIYVAAARFRINTGAILQVWSAIFLTDGGFSRKSRFLCLSCARQTAKF